MDSKIFDISGKRIWVAGHRVMVGGAVVHRLAQEACEILTGAHGDVDLTRQADVECWRDKQRPDAIVMAAARVGGIHANSPRRLLDSGRLAALGWRASTELADGLGQMYRWYYNNKVNAAA